MKKRQIVGWTAIVIGTALVIYAAHSINTYGKHQGLSDRADAFFHHNPLWNPLIKLFKGKPQKKLSEHNTPAIITESIGIALIASGGILVFFSKKKRRR